MSKPKITEKINGFVFQWVDHGISIMVNRLQVHKSDGRVAGEILVEAMNGSGKPIVIYPPTSFNFSADRTRRELAKSLTTKSSKLPWSEIVDQLCFGVQDRARKGEPVVELWTFEDIKPPEYLVYPFVIANQPNVLFGPPESGKTQMAMLLCLIMILPWKNNPLGLKSPTECHHPLWLDYEADKDTTQWNFKRIVKGADVGDVALPYRRCRMPLADDVEQLMNHMDKLGTDCLVIDSLAKAAGGDLDKSESPTRLFGAIDQLKCTTIILAHTSKGGEGRKSIYGSTFFEAYARSIWELKSSRDEETMHIGLWDNKANFRGKLDPLAYSLNYDEEHIFVNVEDIKTIDDFMRHLSVSNRILEALKDNSKSPAELKEILSDVAGATFYAEIARMVKRKKLIKMGLGKDLKYGLPYYEKS